ncbi:MAG: hypothetical protein QM278_04950 [Pseudomonadota bacterium]|nr:hypothetical protein [Pseudomonadota bacterium]
MKPPSTDTEKPTFSETVKECYPDRSDDQVTGILFSYCAQWGRDYRFAEVPVDQNGRSMGYSLSLEDPKFTEYVGWLDEYLLALDAEPETEQIGLCRYVADAEPEDAMFILGKNAALHQFDAEWVEMAIENGMSFEEYYKENEVSFVKYWKSCCEDLPQDEFPLAKFIEDERKFFERVLWEMGQKEKFCPHVRHADAGYRIPLSIALKKEKNKEERINLLKLFYHYYNTYSDK